MHPSLVVSTWLMGLIGSTIPRLGVLVLLVCGRTAGLRAELVQDQPAKELVQYVRDAVRLGLMNTQIEQNAVKAGWPAASVKAAIQKAISTPAALDSEAANRANAPARDTLDSASAVAISPAPASNSVASTRAASAMETHGEVSDEYRIGAGDVLQISVWKEPDASVGSTVVRPDGKISLPLLKELEVVGLTPRQMEQLITERLTRFIAAADVTVVVAAINSKKVYLVGAVKKEGPIPFTYRMTIMQAISEAGGLTDYAKRRKIYILRTLNGKDYRLPFDYEAVLKGERMELNIPLMPGDTVVVPN